MPKKTKSPTFSDTTIVVSQILLYLVVTIPLRLWFRANRTLPTNINLFKKGSLLVANHQSFADGFFVVFGLPFKTYLRIIPCRFPVTDWIMRNPMFNPFFFPFLQFVGCFSIGETSTEKMKSLFYIRSLLKNRKTVVLFPEGGINSDKEVGELKKGIDFLMNEAINVTFVRFKGFNKNSSGEKNCSVTYGEIFEPPPKMSVAEMKDYLNSL